MTRIKYIENKDQRHRGKQTQALSEQGDLKAIKKNILGSMQLSVQQKICSARGVCVHITYPNDAVVVLAPCPGGVRVAHRLTVEHSHLALVLVLAALVAGDLRSS